MLLHDVYSLQSIFIISLSAFLCNSVDIKQERINTSLKLTKVGSINSYLYCTNPYIELLTYFKSLNHEDNHLWYEFILFYK